MKNIDDSFDISKYQISKDPKIWVLDGFLPERLFATVDRELDRDLPVRHVDNEFNHANKVRMVELQRNNENGTEVLFNVLTKLANIHEVDKCRRVVISEIWGVDQDAHIDKISVASLAPENQSLGFLNLDNFQRYDFTPSTVAPTFSFVINFNDVGELVFPHIAPIVAKRGQIVMFQNYYDGEERRIHPLAKHYGGYNAGRSKRIVTAGILTNRTPDLTSKKTEPGALYLLNWGHEHDVRADKTPRPRFQPKDRVYISLTNKELKKPNLRWPLGKNTDSNLDPTDLVLDGFIEKSDANKLEWEGGVPAKPVTYKVKLIKDVFSDRMGVKSVHAKTYKRRNDEMFASCGNLCCEIMVSLILTSYIGIEEVESKGWICSCVLCTAPDLDGDLDEYNLEPALAPLLKNTRKRILELWDANDLFKK